MFQAAPLVCKCQNGGVCLESDGGKTVCDCTSIYEGQYCQIKREKTTRAGASSAAAVFVPIFLIILVIMSAVALYVYYQRKRGE